MGKKNKIRYTAKEKPKQTIILSGQIGLQYVDDEPLAAPKKGDLALFPKCDAWHEAEEVQYTTTGFSGYFKVDVWDGKKWCPVVLSELFPRKEHYFSKKEQAMDCYQLCRELLLEHQGKNLVRTYREHYELMEDTDESNT